MNSGGGYSIPKENEFQNMNRWVPATPNKATSSSAGPIPIQLQGSNFETANWQQLLEFPIYQPLGSVSSYQPVQDLNPYQQADRNGGPLGSVSSYQPVQDLNPYRQADRNGGPLGSVSSYQPVQDLNPYRQADRNGGPLGSVSSYQPVQDLNPYRQADRNGGHVSNPNSFMALLGFDDSYNIGGPLLDDNQGTRVSQGYPSMHDYISKGNDTLESNRASVNPPWMAPQFLAQHRRFQMVNRPVIPNLNVQASVDWIDNHSAAVPMMEQNHHLVSSECTASKDVFQLPEDQFLVPSRLEYNLNLPARTETEASFSQTPEFFHHTSTTLNQAAKSLENKQSEILQLPEPERRLSLSGEKQIRLTENGTQRSSELQQTIVDTSSRIISTPEKILANEKDEGEVQVIDMDKTPEHKTPKRRKHRPKVIREGKPKKAPKSEKPKNPESSERPKRKYTRKSSLNAPEIQPSEVIEGTGGSTEATATKSCKRVLSFEQQKSAEQTEENSNTQPELVHQKSMVGFDLNLDNQATEICNADNNIFQRDSVVQISGQNELLSLIHPAPVTRTLAHSIPQGPTINSPHSVRAPPTRTTTFQDLLMGNNNSAGNLAAAAKANINPNSQAHAMYSTETYMGEAKWAQQRKQNELQTLYQQTSTMCNFNNLMPQQRTNITSHAVRHPPTKAATFQELLMENEKCAQRTASSQMVNLNQNNWRSCYNPVQRFTSAENTGQLALQAKNAHDNVVKCGQMILYRSTQPVMITSDGVQGEARRSKRERDFISEQHRFHGITSVNSSLTNRMMENGYKGGYATRQELPEAEKKRRIENMPYVEISGSQNHCLTEIKSRPLQANIGKNDHLKTRPSHFNPYPWLSYPTNISHSAEFRGAERVGNRVSTSSTDFAHSSKQHTSPELPSYISQSHRRGTLANVQVSPSPVPNSGRNLQLVPTNAFLLNSQQTVGNSDTTITARQYSRPTASGLLVKTIRREVPRGDMQAITTVAKAKGAAGPSVSSRKQGSHNQQPSCMRRGQLRKKDIRDLIDDIICQMEHLKLENVSEDMLVQPKNAIVPYKGDGPVVMYQAKKRKPRPKVDLDPESERIWKLLMGKEGPTEGTDTDKEKWWEEERTVFRLRANSFIARMHLVQGDRRFSKWKGSVVDSVIGVFLTQNVSDHLSSSAFMSLAARFPLSLSSRASCTVDDAIVEEEPEICIIDLEDEIPNIDAKHTISCGNSMALENEEKIMTSGTEIVSSLDGHIRGGNNGTLSLDSFDSSICLTNRVSCSGSNSEVEEQLSNPNPSRVYRTDEPTELIQVSSRDSPLESPVRSFHHSENAQQTSFPSCDYQLHLQLNSIQGASEKDFQRLSGGESMSSCPACDASECSSNISDLKLQNRKIFMQNGHPREKTELRPNLNEQLGSNAQHQEGILTTTPIKETTQHPCIDLHHESLTSHSDQTSAIEEVTEPISREQGLSNAANINIKGSSPKNRKGKQDTDKKLVDWDILRKEAQRNNRRSRNKDAMDSMDYETMRHADVKEISDAIRERGMNNMLAERIKDFLNRLVTDHGSIDLEWLRDAPPDKAKDYLLSIRGLGLKSVECVRLLTLHHLAFPVDTNVGRIAVRLGWVPLQPLPESLQLHLLELYPVLETIQKYLWPRLCKLDQRTLYELHYQMITFGKVFCTKSKPNCNACPMRAECRHFASAFASARLALPGPEEQNIVPSCVSVPSDRIPATDTPSRPLLEWDNQLLGVERLTKANCEPIVEEPTTPVQEPEEVSELDIEDSFGEDPDEIPTIKLDFQEFTQNLQCYMQENNLDIQNGDMSKALVAFTAETASLPPQKLKNVSRLRTEHQVYELPDSHPLLKEMDKREPDDPSPYLLAIWTPGETAISTQLPESRCQSDDPSKMCSEKTCFSCNSRREADSNIVRGTLLIPCRTAMRGSFPLNGTYFQVNEMFADHESSMNPIDVPREWIWNLPRRTVYFGTSVSTIFKGLSTGGIQFCFWRGFVCVRGFDQRYRAPRPLLARLHHPASKLVKKSKEEKK